MFVEAFKEQSTGTSLTVQRFRFCTSTVGGMASIPGGGTKILHATRCSQKEESSTDVIQECKERELFGLGNNPLSWNEIFKVLISGGRIN